MSAFVRNRPLIGRDTELAALRDLVRDVAAGRGHAVWIEGEPGIGKSTLLSTGLAGAESLGCQLYVLTADELAQRFPLRVMLDGLHATPHSHDPELRAIGELARGELVGSGAGSDPVPAISEHILTMLDRWCSHAPVVLAMDDIQYADEASAVVWHRLGRVVRQLPLLLVAAARPVPRRADVAQLRRTLLAAGATSMTLEPLTSAQVSRLARDLTGTAAVGQALRQALGQAAGNPLYVHEMVDALSRDGRITRERGTADLIEPDHGAGTSVPKSLAAAIATRLGFVTDRTMEVLRSAALLGVVFSVTDLATVSGRSVPELVPAIEEAVTAGLLTESGSRLAFRHGLIREALHEQTPSGLRLALHGHAARALHEAGAAAEDVARQLLAALPQDEPTTAPQDWVVDWLLHTGRALAYRSPQVAAELLDHAARHLPSEDQRRESLQVILAAVLVLLGRRDEVKPLAERFLATAGNPDHAAEMTSHLAWALASSGQYEEAREVLRHALQAPDLDIERLAALRAMYARVLLLTNDALTVEVAERALAEAKQAGDQLAAVTAMHVLALARHFYRGDPAGALDIYDRALTEAGDDASIADLRLVLLYNRANMLFDLGRTDDSESATHELLRAAERGAAPPRLATMRLGVAAHHYFRGRWDDALAEVEATLDESDRMAKAADRYTATGATWDLRRADTRLRPLGLRRQRAPRRRASTGWDALTPTELDVAHLVAEGLPNPDIAARLYSSRRTIEVHVSHILTKLEVRSRVEIAREAALHVAGGGESP